MKILLASSSSGSRGGGELYLLYLARALAVRGHEPILWTSDHYRMDELATSFAAVGPVHRAVYPNTYDRRLRSLAAYCDRGTSGRVATSWQAIEADVIHINKQNLEDGLDLLAATAQLRTPSLTTIHLTQSARYLRAVMAWPRDFVSRRALHAYDGPMVAVLENRQRDLVGFLGPSPRIRMIPNGVPLFDLSQRATIRATKRADLHITEDQTLVVAVGRLVAQKRPLTFLDQARGALDANPKLRFLWVGDGVMADEWDTRVAELGLANVVRRLAWQTDVASILFAADLFLHVAEFEGLPLAILEAMSAQLPCAISRNLLAEMPFFGPDDILPVDDDAGWAATTGNTERLQELGARVRKIAEAQFSFDTMAERYETLYRETMEARR